MPIESSKRTAPVRDALGKSRVAAVAIALFLYWALYFTAEGLWIPVFRILNNLVEAVAIMDIPYFARPMTLADRTLVLESLHRLYAATVSIGAAWFLARWVYGTGPIQSLVKCVTEFKGESNA